MNPIQEKNAQVQGYISQQIEYIIAILELLDLILGTIPGFIWPGWNSGKRVDQTTESDLEGLTPSQASAWANAVTVAYTETEGDQ